LIQRVLPYDHDLGGARSAEGHEEVAAGGRPGEAEVELDRLAGRDVEIVDLLEPVIGVGGIWMLERLELNAPELAAADGTPGLLDENREGDGARRRFAEHDVVVHRVREKKDLLAVVGKETARVTIQRATACIGEGEVGDRPRDAVDGDDVAVAHGRVDRGGRVGAQRRQPSGKRSRQGRIRIVILQACRLVQRHGCPREGHGQCHRLAPLGSRRPKVIFAPFDATTF
jgi:hypothetical protein